MLVICTFLCPVGAVVAKLNGDLKALNSSLALQENVSYTRSRTVDTVPR